LKEPTNHSHPIRDVSFIPLPRRTRCGLAVLGSRLSTHMACAHDTRGMLHDVCVCVCVCVCVIHPVTVAIVCVGGGVLAEFSRVVQVQQKRGNKKITAQESRDAIDTFYGGKALATAPASQRNKQPASESIGDIVTDTELDTPMFQGFKHKTGLQHPEGHEVDDTMVDASTADCADNKDCTTTRSPLLYKGNKGEGSLKASGTDTMSAAKADKDISTFFKTEDKEVKTEAMAEEKKAAGIGLSSKAARTDAKAYFTKEQTLAEYGVGPEGDHAIVINQAMGVDAMMPESMFTSNPEPGDDTIDEINEAIQAQRNEGYTNGDGMPANDIEVP